MQDWGARVEPGSHRDESAIIGVDRVSHHYARSDGKPATVLSDVSLALSPGQILSLVGPSGCGKSTLLGILAGLIEPTAGGVTRRSGRIGIVSQRPGLLAWRTLYQNVLLPLELEKREAGAEGRVRAALELAQLSDRAADYPVELSGGMQSRASIARALVTQPELLLLDEPFNDLDEITGQELLVALSALLAKTRPAVLMITHSLSHAAFLSDTVLVMSINPGRIVGRVDVGMPHPRSANFFDSDTFHHATAEIRQRLVESKRQA